MKVLIATVIRAIPFNGVLFPFADDWQTIDALYTSLPYTGGQIVSSIGSGAFFFTEVFSPAISCLFTVLAIKFGEKYSNASGSWKSISFLYMAIEVALGVGMYNLPITLTHVFQTGIPLLAIAMFAKDPESVR